MNHVEIKSYLEKAHGDETVVHYSGAPGVDYTLCHADLLSVISFEVTTAPVTCPRCLAVARHVQGVSSIPAPEDKRAVTVLQSIEAVARLRTSDHDMVRVTSSDALAICQYVAKLRGLV